MSISDAPKCGAKTRSGNPCRAAAMRNGRCRKHGGKSLAGIASPRFRTGRYAKSLPLRLAARYAEAQADPNRIVLSEEIALLDARATDLLSRVDTGESGEAWKRLSALLREHDRAKPEQRAALLEAMRFILGGLPDAFAWAEVMALVDQRRKLVTAEAQRRTQAQHFLTVERACLLLGRVQQIVSLHVQDRDARQRIEGEMARLLEVEGR